jgi:hypothetical protein
MNATRSLLIPVLFFCFVEEQALAVCLPSKSKIAATYRFPVVVKVPESLWSTPVEQFEAWSFKNAKWHRVAIQVDEKNADDSYVLENGIPYTKNTDNGLADGNDEIAMHGQDLGLPIDLKDVSQVMKDRLQKIAVIHVCSQDLYLGSMLVGHSKLFATWPFDAIFDRDKKIAEGRSYRYHFHESQPMLIGRVIQKSQGQELPAFEESIFAMPMIPAFWLMPGLTFDHSDFSSEIECWRSGPVRSIVAVGVKMRKFFSLLKLHLFTELVFYQDYFQIPTKIEMTFDAFRFLNYGSGIGYVLRFPKEGGWLLKSNLAPLPEAPQRDRDGMGVVHQTAKQYSPDGIFRAWGTRTLGSFMVQVRVDEKALDLVPPPYLLRQDTFESAVHKRAWSWIQGLKGNLGVFIDISQVPRGEYDFTLDLMLSDRANDGFTDFRPMTWEWQKLPQ